MNFATRLAVAAALLSAVGGTLTFLAGGAASRNEPAAATQQRWESAAQCKQCHADVYAEWLGSHHQIAFTNPEVRALSEDFRKEECKDCHLPRPLAVTGFGKRTLPRGTHLDEGISCISCHLAPNGGILGRHDRPDVPCKPQRSEEFFSVEACASCHNQHGTTDQWRTSHYPAQGIDCSSCHMPEVVRQRADGSTRTGRNHVFPGCHDKAMLQSAGQFTVEQDGNQVLFRLANTGAGHNFPTEERHRAVDILYRFVVPAAAGVPDQAQVPDQPTAEWTLLHRARQPYRDESTPVGPGAAPFENTQLPAGAEKLLRVAIPAGASAVEARLWYRLTPFCGDDSPQSTLLFERRVELR